MRATEVKTEAAAPSAEGAQPMEEEKAVEPTDPTSGVEDTQEVGCIALRFAWLPAGGRHRYHFNWPQNILVAGRERLRKRQQLMCRVKLICRRCQFDNI